MPFITANKVQLYYEISGSGPRLLYISGPGADLRNKPNVFDSPLADRFEILSFDQRGLGQSDRPDIRYSVPSEIRFYEGGHDFYEHDSSAYEDIIRFLKVLPLE